MQYSDYANNNVFMLQMNDKIAHVCYRKKINNGFKKIIYFLLTDMNLEIFLNESSLINEIKQWLSGI